LSMNIFNPPNNATPRLVMCFSEQQREADAVYLGLTSMIFRSLDTRRVCLTLL
jgi:hypothetical protein